MLFQNFNRSFPLRDFLGKSAPGDTLKMFVQGDPLLPPYVLFRYIEFKVTSHDVVARTRHQIKFAPVLSHGQEFDTLILTESLDDQGCLINALIGSVYQVPMQDCMDASKASSQTIAEINREQEALKPTWREKGADYSIVLSQQDGVYDYRFRPSIYDMKGAYDTKMARFYLGVESLILENTKSLLAKLYKS